MKKNGFNWIRLAMVGIAMSSMVACSDDAGPAGKGEAEIEITDAPSDDANIKSVMVTVAEVKVNGQALQGFQKQTIDLKAYQEGSTKLLLGSTTFDAKTYSNLTLVLDLDTDEDGNAPGCYVLTNDNAKFKLRSTATGKLDVTINQAWKIANQAKSRIVIDFDLRKSIKASDDAAVKYAFVSDASLNKAVRITSRENSGTIKGSYSDDSNTNAEMVVVYAYKRGTFNAATETQAQGEDQIMFANATSSAVVKSTLTGSSYTLAFVEEGDYELHFVAYHKDTASGRYEYSASLKSETSADGSVADVIKVKAGVSINISSSIKGTI